MNLWKNQKKKKIKKQNKKKGEKKNTLKIVAVITDHRLHCVVLLLFCFVYDPMPETQVWLPCIF